MVTCSYTSTKISTVGLRPPQTPVFIGVLAARSAHNPLVECSSHSRPTIYRFWRPWWPASSPLLVGAAGFFVGLARSPQTMAPLLSQPVSAAGVHQAAPRPGAMTQVAGLVDAD